MTAPEKPVWESRKVARKAIAIEPDFQSRQGHLDDAHIKTLVVAIKRGSKLPPVLLWHDEGRNSLVLLDGAHRLVAGRSGGWREEVPARVVTCSRRDALLIAAGANTRDALPLSQQERADLAWRLVREPVEHFTKGEIARAAGIAERTVTTMRARWRTMKGAGAEPSGAWWRDRKEQEKGDDGEFGTMPQMTDAERNKLVTEMAARLRKAAGQVAFKDESLFADALDRAFGRKLIPALDYLYATDEWSEVEVKQDDEDDDDELEVAF